MTGLERLKQRASLVAALLVSSAWHMRRVYVLMRHHLPQNIRLFCCPVPAPLVPISDAAKAEDQQAMQQELRLLNQLRDRGYVV